MQIPLFVATGALFCYAVYCLVHERDLATVDTDLSAAENRQLIVFTFQKLGWGITQNTQYVVRADVPHKWYGFVGQTATALIQEKAVHLNILHHSASKGRSPFSYGFNGKKLTQLIRTISEIMPSITNNQDN
ncbi:hypothetical protein [Hymenobacter translucens]|uniref:hypothetical protein n=1 Tax=Hymenobacter translucens TaxID=2886507 RepID=UPI001D0DFFF2|nr:hypothetical protein [Hymenobacter translucens]